VTSELSAGWIAHFEPYKEVHRGNVAAVFVVASDRSALSPP